jgi:hypothetical protein
VDGLQVLPAERAVDLAARVADVLVDHVGGRIVGEVPDVLQDPGAGQHLTGMGQEQLQQRELLGRQVQPLLPAPGLPARRVQPQLPDLQHGGSLDLAAADQRP